MSETTVEMLLPPETLSPTERQNQEERWPGFLLSPACASHWPKSARQQWNLQVSSPLPIKQRRGVPDWKTAKDWQTNCHTRSMWFHMHDLGSRGNFLPLQVSSFPWDRTLGNQCISQLFVATTNTKVTYEEKSLLVPTVWKSPPVTGWSFCFGPVALQHITGVCDSAKLFTLSQERKGKRQGSQNSSWEIPPVN